MSNRIKNNLKNLVGQTLNQYYSKVKPTISDLRYKQEYQNRIIECMVGEVDDNYVTTPETDNPIVKLEHSKEGVIKIPQIKGKTILIDEDGNKTDTPGEGCRLVSVGEEEDNKLIILSNNSNLLGSLKETLTHSKYNITINSFTDNEFSYTSNVWNTGGDIKITLPKGVYTYGYTPLGVGVYFIDVKCYLNNNAIKTITLGGVGNRTFELTENYDYIKIFFKNNALDTINGFKDFRINIGESASSYIPKQSHKTEILLDEPLRKLPNGVCDEIVGNKVIRRTDKIVIDETKRFNYSILEDNNIVRFWSSRDNLGIPKIKSGSVVKCNILQNIPYGILELRNDEGIGVKQSRGVIDIGINLSKERNVFNNTDFEKWLSENNVIVIYELEEPIIEELPNGITLQGFDDTTMYIENSITPTVSYGYNALIPYKQELLNQKEDVETNTLDIENNIIPYLMDMEYNLMLMEDE